jgi:hypothetical protein
MDAHDRNLDILPSGLWWLTSPLLLAFFIPQVREIHTHRVILLQ